MLEEFTNQTFDALLGQRFEVVPTHGHPFVMVLAECRRVGDMPPDDLGFAIRREPFCLLFYTGRDVVVPQQICRMRNRHLGEFSMFIVPVGPDQRGMRYEAVFT
ncbi:MAG TPA: hypothetical protein VFZ89_13865 [Solirubrobacteraceae bacterium]